MAAGSAIRMLSPIDSRSGAGVHVATRRGYTDAVGRISSSCRRAESSSECARRSPRRRSVCPHVASSTLGARRRSSTLGGPCHGVRSGRRAGGRRRRTAASGRGRRHDRRSSPAPTHCPDRAGHGDRRDHGGAARPGAAEAATGEAPRATDRALARLIASIATGLQQQVPASTITPPSTAAAAAALLPPSLLAPTNSRNTPSANVATPSGTSAGRRRREGAGRRGRRAPAHGSPNARARGRRPSPPRSRWRRSRARSGRRSRTRRGPTQRSPRSSIGRGAGRRSPRRRRATTRRARSSALQRQRPADQSLGGAVGGELADRHELAPGAGGERGGDDDAGRREGDRTGDPAPGEGTG